MCTAAGLADAQGQPRIDASNSEVDEQGVWEQRKDGNVGLSLFYALFPGLFQFIFLLRNWVLKSHFLKRQT